MEEHDTGSDPLNAALSKLSSQWKRGQPLYIDKEVREVIKEVLIQSGRW